VEAARVVTPNRLTFQLTTGYKQFYVMGFYIPPNDTTRVDALWTGWQVCLDTCVLIALEEDLNINIEHPWDKRKEVIADLLDEINLTVILQVPLVAISAAVGQETLNLAPEAQVELIPARLHIGGTFGTFGGLGFGRCGSMTRITVQLLQRSAQ